MLERKELKTAAKEQIKGNILVFLGISIVWSLILSASSLTYVGAIILTGVYSLGLAMVCLEIIRTKKCNFDTSFKGFNQFGSAFVAGFLSGLFVILWTLLFIIPGIIAALRYSMTFYILADNPKMSGLDAINKSKEMMNGHKTEFFVLILSFFPWYLLCLITFGFAAIYVAPYVSVTFADFYENLKQEMPKEEKLIEENSMN